MPRPLCILHLEDDPDYSELVKSMFAKEGLDVEMVPARDYAQFIAALERHPFDIILADYLVPGGNGIQALAAARQKCPDTPFVLVSGAIGDQAAIETLKSGATDYVLKQSPERLVPAVRRAVQEAQARAQQHQAEARLRLLSAALESAANTIVITDRAGTVLWVNPAFTRLTGYSKEEILGQNPRLLKSGVHDQPFYKQIWDTILAGRVWHSEMVNRRKDGTLYTEENTITPVRDERGAITHFIAVKQDITERKQAEVALLESQHRFSIFMEHLPVAAFVKDQQGRALFANKYLEETFGWQAWEGKSTLELLPPEMARRMIEDDHKALAQGLIVVQETIVDARGRERTFDTYKFPIPVAGKPTLLGGVAVDTTERKRLEAELRQAQKMEAVGKLAGGVAHDFNNLLTVIGGNAEMALMSAGQLTQPIRDCLKQIVDASARAANLTRQLLAFGRKQLMQPQPLNLNEVIANLTKMLTRIIGEDIQLQCTYAAGLPFVQADVGMMEQVLLNLVVNARDAMPQGGHLLIATEKTTFDAPSLHAHREARTGEFVCISVRDTGCGIAPEHLPQIFDPFFTTKDVGKGTGLGLATVYGIVQQHQGWIEVASEVAAGSKFNIFLPAIAAPATVTAEPPPELKLPGGTETILLVEDDPAVRLLTQHILASFGYRVFEARSGREAEDCWRAHAAEIDLLLTDLVLPGGVNGRAVAQRLRQDKPALKVILTSGYRADAAGGDTAATADRRDHFLQKPCSPRTLIETIRRCLDAH